MFAKKRVSKFKTKDGDSWLETWNRDVLNDCGLSYRSESVQTSYGSTWVYHKNHHEKEKTPLVFLPGFRTCGLFWDLNHSLEELYDEYRIYLIDVIGQPSLSDRCSPPIKTNQYALWLEEVFDALGIEKFVVSGASFGGLLTLKVSNHMPDRVLAACYFNPAGFQFINVDMVSMYRTLKPVLFPSVENVSTFLFQFVVEPELPLSELARKHLLGYQHYVIKNFKFGSDYPYKVKNNEIENVEVPSYFFLCRDDKLINQQNTDARARSLMPGFRETFFFSKIGHGIEVSKEAMRVFKDTMQKHTQGD